MRFYIHLAFLWTFLPSVCCSIWKIKPQYPLNIQALNGRWWTLRWMPPQGFNKKVVMISYNWNALTSKKSNRLDIFIRGRYLYSPGKCFSQQAKLCPSSKPGYFNYRAPDTHLRVYEMFFACTDYLTYTVEVGCAPRFQKGCALTVEVRTRKPFAGPKLRSYLDKIIKHKLGLNPSAFLDIQGLSRMFPVCPAMTPHRLY